MPPSPAVVCAPDEQFPRFFIPAAFGTDIELGSIQVVTTEGNGEGGFWRLVIEPNCSLSWRQSMAFFIGISVLCMSIATVFALKGYWLIFPFAGLELLALLPEARLGSSNLERELTELSGD